MLIQLAMSNEQPRQFTYAKRYATALASRRPLGQRGEPPFGFSTFLKSGNPPTESAEPQRNCLAMSNYYLVFIVPCSLFTVHC